MPAETLVDRLNKLGLTCQAAPLDNLTSATAALACFPMYMVANLHAWTKDEQFSVPIFDIPGFEAIREAFSMGREERKLPIEKPHAAVLKSLLSHAKPSDLVVYEYALETLKQFLDGAAATVADQTRTAIARMIVRVARASGEGLFGTGEKISRQEESCIKQIADVLSLRTSPAAAEALKKVDEGM
jgi:hypothetical protein